MQKKIGRDFCTLQYTKGDGWPGPEEAVGNWPNPKPKRKTLPLITLMTLIVRAK